MMRDLCKLRSKESNVMTSSRVTVCDGGCLQRLDGRLRALDRLGDYSGGIVASTFS